MRRFYYQNFCLGSLEREAGSRIAMPPLYVTEEPEQVRAIAKNLWGHAIDFLYWPDWRGDDGDALDRR